MFDMGRRDFITLLGGAAAAWPLAARAEQSEQVRRIGVLMASEQSDPLGQSRFAALRQALADLGWNEGRNLRIEDRWSGAAIDRIQAYAVELVRLAPDVLVGNSTPVLSALRQQTRSIPIVFVIVNDPVAQGFIANLAHPGGNITGFTFFDEIFTIGKSLDLLKHLAPAVVRVGVMFNPDMTGYYTKFLRSFTTGPQSIGVELKAAPVRSIGDIESAAAELAEQPGGGLLVAPDTFTLVHREFIIRLAEQRRLPATFAYRQFVKEGALMSYGPDTVDIFRRSASYVDRILKGANPGHLPAQAPVKYEFAINLNTARTLGLNASPTLLALADEVIE
jgi:putative tryptophan/tyrosine transport system substrate-binding protein